MKLLGYITSEVVKLMARFGAYSYACDCGFTLMALIHQILKVLLITERVFLVRFVLCEVANQARQRLFRYPGVRIAPMWLCVFSLPWLSVHLPLFFSSACRSASGCISLGQYQTGNDSNVEYDTASPSPKVSSAQYLTSMKRWTLEMRLVSSTISFISNMHQRALMHVNFA